MKTFNLKNYGIENLDNEPFKIKKITETFEDTYYDENHIKHITKINKIKRYIVINKNNENEIYQGLREPHKWYKTFKKALLGVLRDLKRFDYIDHNKCEKFYNYKQDEKSIEEYHNKYFFEDDIMSKYCFLLILKRFNGHMSKSIREYIHLIDDDPEFDYSGITDDYIEELILHQIPHRYYKDKYFIKNIPKYAKIMSREFYYTKKGEKHYSEKISERSKNFHKIKKQYYEKLLYNMIK